MSRSVVALALIEVETARELGHPDVRALVAAAIDRARIPLPARGRGELIIRPTGASRRSRRKPAGKSTASRPR